MFLNTKANMNIILPKNLNKMWEGSWLKFLLGDHFHSAIYHDETDFPIVDNSLLIAGYNTSYKPHLNRLIENNFNFAVLVLSDEFLQDQCEYIQKKECKFVIRNYIHPSLYKNEKVLHVGLGFKKNFDKYVVRNEFAERDLTWSFIGSIHGNSRNESVNTFKQLEGGFVHITKHFNSDDYLSTEKYCDILCRSCYAICPQGHANNDTFRIYEALEAGAIPVVLKNSESHPFNPSYWYYLFPGEKDLPFVMADSWEDALKIAQNDIARSFTSIRLKQCQLFWEKWKSTWKYQVHVKLSLLAS
jgi:hypothetical protein